MQLGVPSGALFFMHFYMINIWVEIEKPEERKNELMV